MVRNRPITTPKKDRIATGHFALIALGSRDLLYLSIMLPSAKRDITHKNASVYTFPRFWVLLALASGLPVFVSNSYNDVHIAKKPKIVQ